jgi:hypothetical protein
MSPKTHEEIRNSATVETFNTGVESFNARVSRDSTVADARCRDSPRRVSLASSVGRQVTGIEHE